MSTGETIKVAVEANAPALKIQLIEALSRAIKWVEGAGEFAAEQAPELVQEIVYFEVATQGFDVLTGIGLAVAGFFGVRYFIPAFKKATDDFVEFLAFIAAVGSGAVGFIGVFQALGNVMPLLKPIVAPRLFLLEYLRGLLG